MAEHKLVSREYLGKGGWNALRLQVGDRLTNYLSYLCEAPTRHRSRHVRCRCDCGRECVVRLIKSALWRDRKCPLCGNGGKGVSQMPPEDRFWAKVNRKGPDDCWLWTGAHRSDLGYGHMNWRGGHRAAHRIAYELMVGEIPEGLVLDHLCRTPACVNPKHLEPVTQRVNVIVRGQGPFARRAAQTHCLRGHEFTPENTYIHKSRGVRICRECHRVRNRKQKDESPNR